MKNIKFQLEEDKYFELHEVMAKLKVSTYEELIDKIIEMHK